MGHRRLLLCRSTTAQMVHGSRNHPPLHLHWHALQRIKAGHLSSLILVHPINKMFKCPTTKRVNFQRFLNLIIKVRSWLWTRSMNSNLSKVTSARTLKQMNFFNFLCKVTFLGIAHDYLRYRLTFNPKMSYSSNSNTIGTKPFKNSKRTASRSHPLRLAKYPC